MQYILTLPQDINRNQKISALNGKEFFLVDVIAHILHHLKEQLLLQLRDEGKEFKASDFNWVITVPAISKSRGKDMMLEAGYMVSPNSNCKVVKNFNMHTQLYRAQRLKQSSTREKNYTILVWSIGLDVACLITCLIFVWNLTSPVEFHLRFHTKLGVLFVVVCFVCALLLVGVAHAFGMVSHVQQSVRMAKHVLKSSRK